MDSSFDRRARPRNLPQKTRYWTGRMVRTALITYVGGIFLFAICTAAVKAFA